MQVPLPINLLAETFVVGDQDPVVREGLLDYLSVAHSTSFVVHGKHIVPLLAQPARHKGTSAFVNEETHLQCLRHEGHEVRIVE